MTEKKPHLSVFGGPFGPLGPPSIDEARRQLGGPWVGGPDIGRVVQVFNRAVEAWLEEDAEEGPPIRHRLVIVPDPEPES